MASSAFYPIIYACVIHGYEQMDVEAGATRYAVTVLVYLTAVTIYGVSRSTESVLAQSLKCMMLKTTADKNTSSVATRMV